MIEKTVNNVKSDVLQISSFEIFNIIGHELGIKHFGQRMHFSTGRLNKHK